MDKQAVITSLQFVATEYAKVVATAVAMPQFMALLEDKRMHKGLCGYIRYTFPCNYEEVMYPLFEDKLSRGTAYWYTSPMSIMLRTVITIQQQALQPRLDHLNRTITRLQAELNTVQQHG